MKLYAALALLSLPGWIFGLLSGKLIGIVAGIIVRPLMDALKRAWGWLDGRSDTVKQIVVVGLSFAAVYGLAFIHYTVTGCSISDPSAPACNPFTWDAATWQAIIGAAVATLLKMAQQVKRAAANTPLPSPAVQLGAPAAKQ